MVTRLFGRITGRKIPERDVATVNLHKSTHTAIKIYATLRHMTIREATRYLVEIGLKVEELRERRQHQRSSEQDSGL